MINFNFKEECCGCEACSNICSVNAIRIEKDKMGFAYPKVNKEKCIDCGKCKSVCPHYNAETHKYTKEPNNSWLYTSPDNEAKKTSSSGAVFYELAKNIINDGGYVAGCIWDDDFNAKHILTNSLDGIKKMQGSKYVQSSTDSVFQKIYEILDKDKVVLFCGTPCQATALDLFINNKGSELRKNLFIASFICHGVAGPEVWQSYVRWLEKKYNSRLISVNFRDKSKEGYKKSYCKYTFESGKVVFEPTYLPTSKYIETTLVYNLGIRKSCGQCMSKGRTSCIDVIMGDWYAEYKNEGALGTSCIVSYTDKGDKLLECLSGKREFDYGSIASNNRCIEKSSTINSRNDEFIDEFNDNIWLNVEKYYPSKYKYKKLLIKLHIYDLVKKLIK